MQFQRVGDQTGLFSLREKAPRLLLARPGRHPETRVDLGPPNSVGGADVIVGSLSPWTATSPCVAALADTE